MTNNSKQLKPAKKRRLWPKVVLLVVVIIVGYFVKTTYSYYVRLQEGTLDLSSFESGELSSVKGLALGASTSLTIIENIQNDPVAGPENAPITIVAFEDFQCPFCGRAFPVIKEMLRLYPKEVRFVYRDFPLTEIHTDAQLAAEAGQCAHEQGKFWEFHDKLFVNQSALGKSALLRYGAEIGLDMPQFSACLDSGKYTAEVQADFADGLKVGVTGTPTFFINGNKIAGVISLEGFKQIIKYFLNN